MKRRQWTGSHVKALTSATVVAVEHSLNSYIVTQFTIECHFCGTMDQAALDPFEHDHPKIAADFFKRGWREVTSKRYNVIAAACPECAKLADSER